uniref:Methyl-CpG binding domain protein 3 n=1 Tax=Oncorhynchus tshawytscha TaxID=74940 RepID=A0A8C8MMB1_ONCTS
LTASFSDPGKRFLSKPQLARYLGRMLMNKLQRNRQTASIFKQPVTKVTNHPSNKVKTDSHKAVDQPRQLFWERKLSGLSAFEIAEELVKTMDLPRGLKGVGPLCSDKTLLSAISSALPSWLPMTTTVLNHCSLTPLPLCGVCRKQEDLVHNVRRLEEHSDGGHVGLSVWKSANYN